MRRRPIIPTLAATALAALARPAAAQEVAPVATHAVTTTTRTLRGCPLKRVITTPQGWAHVTEGLVGAPPAPDFRSHVAVLVVADASGGAGSSLGPLRLRPDGALQVTLLREDPPRVDTEGRTTLVCFFIVLPPFAGGVHLDHRTLIAGGGSGYVQRPDPASAADRDPMRLPALGPDLRLSFAMADGSALPEAALLRMESVYRRQDLTGRVTTLDFPRQGLALPFPRFRDDVRHVLAAHDVERGLRSVRPLVLSALPADGPDGSPQPVTFRFLLEPIPGQEPR